MPGGHPRHRETAQTGSQFKVGREENELEPGLRDGHPRSAWPFSLGPHGIFLIAVTKSASGRVRFNPQCEATAFQDRKVMVMGARGSSSRCKYRQETEREER